MKKSDRIKFIADARKLFLRVKRFDRAVRQNPKPSNN